MRQFTFPEDIRKIDPKLAFRDQNLKTILVGKYKYYDVEKLIDQNSVDFIITNKSFVYTDLLYNIFGLMIVSEKLLSIITKHITCDFDIYNVNLLDTEDHKFEDSVPYFLIHIREYKPIIDLANSIIGGRSKVTPEGFLIKPKFAMSAARECFVRDANDRFAIYVNDPFIKECTNQNITGFTIL